MTYTFKPGEHDEFVCRHVLAGHVVDGAVEHIDHEDGSVTVEFPLPAETVEAAITTYWREDYESNPEAPLSDAERKALRALVSR